jgi:hypothetical protein
VFSVLVNLEVAALWAGRGITGLEVGNIDLYYPAAITVEGEGRLLEK